MILINILILSLLSHLLLLLYVTYPPPLSPWG